MFVVSVLEIKIISCPLGFVVFVVLFVFLWCRGSH